ncbi:porin family protein [Mesonia aquimarina]|uniref:porin family protein n=1 Tax=Mesonia aquimarina TaxID=1504967 RepID=UPI000EF58CEA|nr:porin family protein [Mesonia aquimarina]
MKKLFLTAVVVAMGVFTAQSQTVDFGVKAGFLNVQAEIETPDGDVSNSEAGFLIGGLVDIGVSENFHVQPELLYGNAGEGSALFIPILAKYYIADSGFAILAGPQGTLDLEEAVEGVNTFGIDATFGASYDITENFFIDARYSFELTNRFKDGGDDFKGHINSLQIGVGYKF